MKRFNDKLTMEELLVTKELDDRSANLGFPNTMGIYIKVVLGFLKGHMSKRIRS